MSVVARTARTEELMHMEPAIVSFVSKLFNSVIPCPVLHFMFGFFIQTICGYFIVISFMIFAFFPMKIVTLISYGQFSG